MELSLKNFETVFHVAIVFNFIYTVESFSNNIKLIIRSPAPFVANGILNFFSILVQYAIESNQKLGEFGGKISKSLQIKFIETDESIKKFVKENDFNFNHSFKASYLFAALFSLFVLILSGYDGYLNQDNLYRTLFIVNIIVFIFHIYVLWKTFRKNAAKIQNGLVAFFFIILLFIFYFIYKNSNLISSIPICKYIPSTICTVSFTVFLSLCPFVFHLLRAFLDILIILSLSFQISFGFIYYFIRTIRKRGKIRKSLKTLRENIG